MTKAKVLPPNDETDNKSPRLTCDLCKSTYNLKTGQKLEASETAGFLGGIAKTVLNSQDSGDMDTYQLGEKNGKIMFTMKGM
jgi:nitrite reductase/ring-hydroxylating ferredoxin subunit